MIEPNASAYLDVSTRMRRKHGPGRDNEWHRVWELPRRDWSDADGARASEALTPLLAKDPTATLRPIQALALLELLECRGLVAAIAVGGGKTLITLLAPVVLGITRALIVLPAKLERKTHAEVKEYRRAWRLPALVQTISVERLARKNQADFLDECRPELIMIDEAHRLANRRAAATKRLARYVRERDPIVAVLTGTLTSERLDEYAHMVQWALGDSAPVPRKRAVVEAWSDCLCEPPKSALGAFETFGDEIDARNAYRERLTHTPGVIVSRDHYGEVPLTIRTAALRPSPQCEIFYRDLEEAWVLPDGQEIEDPLAMARHAYTIALGYWMRWREPGPEPWMEARSAYARLVRETIKETERTDAPLDTEEQVRLAIKAGRFGDGPLAVLQAWREVRPSFTPITVVEWIDQSAVDGILQWCERPGIVWYRHRGIRDALERRGLRVYGRKGEDRAGRPIMNARGDIAVAASQLSSGEGQNLQQFNRSLLLEPPTKAAAWEQLLGRTHREGQTRPVTYEVYAPFGRHMKAFAKARAGAEYVEQTTGARQKLLTADTTTLAQAGA